MPRRLKMVRNSATYLATDPGRGHRCTEQPGWETLKLMQGLRQKRLLVLDNAETILSAGQTGIERATRDMVNCSKRWGGPIRVACCSPAAKSPEIVPPEGQEYTNTATAGLQPEAGRELFRDKGIFAGTESEWEQLVAHYRGNPGTEAGGSRDSRTV